MKFEAQGLKAHSSWSTVSFNALHPMFAYSVAPTPVEIRKLFEAREHFVVIGLGGSILPLKALVDAAELQSHIHFVDHLDRKTLARMLNLENALYCVVSKSGETLEIKTLLYQILESGRQKDCLFVTDPEKGLLRTLVREGGVASLPIPAEIGGRFTHFTPFHRALFERFKFDFGSWLELARQEVQRLKEDSGILKTLMNAIFEPGRSQMILWAYGDRFLGLAEWMQQAIAESLGKISPDGRRHGVMPIVLKGPQDQHSVLQILMEGPQDRSLLFLGSQRRDKKLNGQKPRPHFEGLETQSLESIEDLFFESIHQSFVERVSHESTRQPVMKMQFSEKMEDVIRAIVTIQAFIEFAGKALSINAFDQPGVERGKQIARALLKNW